MAREVRNGGNSNYSTTSFSCYGASCVKRSLNLRSPAGVAGEADLLAMIELELNQHRAGAGGSGLMSPSN